jgi:uncharacterized protein with PIN domain
MVTATFRFHAELNDFLPRERRGGDITCPCARCATTKHMIEALGVPHTEVGRVEVNGEAAGLDRLLAEGDRLEAWPADAAAADASTRSGVGASAREKRFVADAHLGGLARLLRMAGFDTLYDNHFEDSEIERISAREGRIVLTRDRELLKRREIAQGCYVRTLKSTQQLRELFARLRLAPGVRPFTLCLHCNAPLHAVDKSAIEDLLPPAVRMRHTEFSTCDICRRIFWPGSHWQRMRALMEEMAMPDIGMAADEGNIR